jgi:hypothetical protein
MNSLRLFWTDHTGWAGDTFLDLGEKTRVRVPGGHVYLRWGGIASGSELAYAELRFKPMREGLMRFERP